MIKYRLKLTKSRGQIEARETLIHGPSFIIGRGENAEIRYEDPLVSFKHAEAREDANKLTLTDLNSFSGTKVNGRPIQKCELHDGDIISIGLYNIEIKREGSDWILVEERRADKVKGEEEFIISTLKSTSFKDNLPSMTLLSLFLITAIIIAFFWIPLNTDNKASWSSGPISCGHKLLAKDCASCHAVPFQKVNNNTCHSCHKMNDHRMDIHANQNLDKLACTNCHTEHNGSAGLIIKEEKLCLACHNDLSKVLKDTKTDKVLNFENHPDFKVHLFLQETKVPLKTAKDSNTLKLNHKLHLAGPINGPGEKELLNCSSCHTLEKDKKSYQSVSFEASCERCHPLNISKVNPEVKVPHKNADEVFSFLMQFHANEALLKEGQESASEEKRFIPGNLDKRKVELLFLRKDVIEHARNTEHELFTKLSCTVCHDVTEKAKPVEKSNLSSFKITPPENRELWFPSAVFDHSSHVSTECKDCHKGVRKSELTSELLLPELSSCKECHGGQGHTQKVSSTCISCHPYHLSEPIVKHKAYALR